MKYCVSFDIKFKTNKINLLKIIKHYGFKKIHSSLYFGDLNKDDLFEMKTKIMEYIKLEDCILVFPICMNCYSKLDSFCRFINFEEELYKIY
jgi:CRISPR-associated protein Cas2